MSDVLINDPIPSLVQSLHDLDAALTSAKIGVKDAQDVQRDIETQLKNVKQRILDYMVNETGEWQLDTEHAKLSVRKTPKKLVIDSSDAIPGDYWKLQEPTLDKSGLKKALEAASVLNQDIPGAHLEEGDLTIAVSWKEGK